jgi:hypothetical protein
VTSKTVLSLTCHLSRLFSVFSEKIQNFVWAAGGVGAKSYLGLSRNFPQASGMAFAVSDRLPEV